MDALAVGAFPRVTRTIVIWVRTIEVGLIPTSAASPPNPVAVVVTVALPTIKDATTGRATNAE